MDNEALSTKHRGGLRRHADRTRTYSHSHSPTLRHRLPHDFSGLMPMGYSTDRLLASVLAGTSPLPRSYARGLTRRMRATESGAKGGVRFLRAVGFVEEGAGDEAAFVLPAAVGAEQLAAGKAALKAAVKQFSHVQEALRTAENEAAAQKLRDLRDLSKQNNSKRDAATAGEKDAIKAEIAAERFEWERQRDPTNFK